MFVIGSHDHVSRNLRQRRVGVLQPSFLKPPTSHHSLSPSPFARNLYSTCSAFKTFIQATVCRTCWMTGMLTGCPELACPPRTVVPHGETSCQSLAPHLSAFVGANLEVRVRVVSASAPTAHLPKPPEPCYAHPRSPGMVDDGRWAVWGAETMTQAQSSTPCGSRNLPLTSVRSILLSPINTCAHLTPHGS